MAAACLAGPHQFVTPHTVCTPAAEMSTENVSTYTHELPATADGNKRVLTYAVFGLPLASHSIPEQYIIYHHGWPSCR